MIHQCIDCARLQLYSGLIAPGFNCNSGLIEPGLNCIQIKVDNSKREVHNMAAEVVRNVEKTADPEKDASDYR